MRATGNCYLFGPRHSAFTLLELAVVMALLGVIAIAASSMLGSQGVVDSLRAREDAQQLAQALRTAKTTAIASGLGVRIEHIEKKMDDRLLVGFRTATDAVPAVLLQPDAWFSESLAVNWSTKAIVFYPSGMTDTSLSIEVAGESSLWIVDVRSASGQVTLAKKK